SFASPSSPQTTVTFDKVGTYVLQLQATDGHTTVSKTVKVTVDIACENIHDPSEICSICPAVTVVPAQLHSAVQGLPYAQQLTGNGCQAPYSFSPCAPLPAGLSIS